MNLQTLKSKLNKGQKNQTIEVILNVDNQEHIITSVSQTPDKIIIAGTLSDGIHAGDSIENAGERAKLEEAETTGSPVLQEASTVEPEVGTFETVSEVPEAEAAVDQMYGMDVEEETSTTEAEEGKNTL